MIKQSQILHPMVEGNQLARKIQQLVFNEFQVDVDFVSISSKDTDFIYQIENKGKRLNNSLSLEISAFIKGIISCWKSF